MESLVPHLGWLAHPNGDEVARFLAEGWFEYREQAFWWLYLREGDTVIDGGAHFGLYASLAGRLTGETGRVFAVEANRAITPLLAENLGRHAGSRGELIPAVLTSQFGEVDFFPSGGARQAYSGTVPESPGAVPYRAQAISLDELCRERAVTRVALAKLDLEGDEIEALRGARGLVSAGSPALWMVEFSEANLRRRSLDTRALFEELTSLGYTVCRFDELRCELTPLEYRSPVWYENYFATKSVDEVNRRLSTSCPEATRIARDILRRGAAAMALRDSPDEAARILRTTEGRADQAEARAREAGSQAAEAIGRIEELKIEQTRQIEELRVEAARQIEELKAEAARRIGEEKAERDSIIESLRQMADSAAERAKEASGHLEESWRRIGEANWRADQACDRVATAAERAEAAQRRFDVADRRAANARYEADFLKARLRELMDHRDLARVRTPEWAKEFLASAQIPAPPSTAGSDLTDPMQCALYHLAGKNFNPRVILDIGAGKGYWSRNAHTFFPDAAYYMIDPLDENEEDLRQICERDSRFHFLKAALGNADGPVEIHVTPDLVSSHILPHPKADPASRRLVPLRTADSLAQEGCLASADLVKIDVQCYELKVLVGAERLLETVEVLIVEVNLFRFMSECPIAHEVIGWLAARGFVLFDIAGSVRRPFEDDLAQLDLVFVSSSSRLIESTRWT